MKSKRTIVYVAGFLFSIPLALTSYINSSFLQVYIQASYVGIVYIIAALITILGLFEMPHILTRLGARQTTLFFSMLALFAAVMMSQGNAALIVIPAFILYFVSCSCIIATLDIFIEDFSKDTSVGKLRGLYLVVTNGAWVCAQLISGRVIARSSFGGIYFIASVFLGLLCFTFIFFMRGFKDPHYVKIPIGKTIKAFLKNKHLSRIYIINLILKFFFAWMIIYTPIYLHEYIGFGWSQIGIIFTIMLLPFVILEFPLGKLSDKSARKKCCWLDF